MRNMENVSWVKPILSSHNAGILARHERVLTRVGEEVILSCEVYGYFSEVPDIIWRTSDQEPINTDHPYFPFVNISTSEGDRLIQDGGSGSVPSKISTMRILINDSNFFQMFLCDIGLEEVFFQIAESDPGRQLVKHLKDTIKCWFLICHFS